MSQRRFAIKRDLNLLRQRCEAQLIMVYQGGMFRCDEHMICYAKNPTIWRCYNGHQLHSNQNK